MTGRPAILLLASLLAVPALARAQSGTEIDHVFVFVEPRGLAEAAALREAGFFVDTSVSRHVGQGTASRAAIFENAYFELIWLDPDVPVDTATEGIVHLLRAADWRRTGVSPFGVGLRRDEGAGELPVPSTPYTGDWMRPGSAILLLVGDASDAFDMFVMPSYMAVPAWIEYPRAQALLAHPLGARRITGVEIRGPAAHRPSALEALAVDRLRFVEAAEPLLIVEIDGGESNSTVDLRPGAPVLIRH